MSKLMKEKPRLGRGLSSLISAPLNEGPEILELPAALGSGEADGIISIPIDEVVPNPNQPRKNFDEAALLQLGASLRLTGLIQPIVVRLKGTHYELIAGERRWRAAKVAGFSHIRGIVRDVDALAQAEIALVENTQREDLNPIDRAAAYQQLLQQLNITQSDLATKVGEDRSSIANYLRLLDLSEVAQQGVRDGKLTLGHAKVLAGVTNLDDQQRLARRVMAEGMSVRQLESMLKPKGGNEGIRPQVAYLARMEKEMSGQMGMRVQVRTGKKGAGRLVIHYASLDQFEELLGKLGVKLED